MHVEIRVTVVGNVSLNTKEALLKIGDKSQPNFDEFSNDVKKICNDLNHRIYWRVSQSEFMIIRNYIGLKSALNLMMLPRMYVVTGAEDESKLVSSSSSDEKIPFDYIKPENSSDGDFRLSDLLIGANEPTASSSSIMGENNDSMKPLIISDVEILRCITSDDEEVNPNDSSQMIYTCEYRDLFRVVKILAKGFPEVKKKLEADTFVEQVAVMKSEASASAKGKKT